MLAAIVCNQWGMKPILDVTCLAKLGRDPVPGTQVGRLSLCNTWPVARQMNQVGLPSYDVSD